MADSWQALRVAIMTYRDHKSSWEGIMKRGMEKDSTWENAAVQYEQVFEWAFIDPPYIKWGYITETSKDIRKRHQKHHFREDINSALVETWTYQPMMSRRCPGSSFLYRMLCVGIYFHGYSFSWVIISYAAFAPNWQIVKFCIAQLVVMYILIKTMTDMDGFLLANDNQQ